MAPVITNIIPAGATVGDPVEGPTAGRVVVEIYGDGFRLPPPPPESGPTGPVVAGTVVSPEPKTVSVTFGGREAVKVAVIRTNLLRVLTPISPIAATKAAGHGAGLVDVTVTNLDDNEDPIPGETITRAGGYTYRHVKLDATAESDLLRVVRKLIREWKRQVLPEVVFLPHTDYDDDVATPIVDIAALPSIALIMRGTPENRFYSINDHPDERVGDLVEIRRKPRTIDILFDVVGISDHKMELVNLLAAATTFMEENPCLELDRDPTDLSKGTVEYELDFQPGGEFAMSSSPSNSNIRQFSGGILIRGFDLEGFTGFPLSAVRDLSAENTEGVSLDVEKGPG